MLDPKILSPGIALEKDVFSLWGDDKIQAAVNQVELCHEGGHQITNVLRQVGGLVLELVGSNAPIDLVCSFSCEKF